MGTKYGYSFSVDNGRGGMNGSAKSLDEAAFLLGANVRYSMSIGRTISATSIESYCETCEGTGRIVKHKAKFYHTHVDKCFCRCPDCKGHDSHTVTDSLTPMAMCGMNAQTDALCALGQIAQYKECAA